VGLVGVGTDEEVLGSFSFKELEGGGGKAQGVVGCSGNAEGIREEWAVIEKGGGGVVL